MNGKETVYELAMSEPGFKAWLDARQTTNPRSLETLASFMGSARRFANENGIRKPLKDLTDAEAANLARLMKQRGFSQAIFGCVRMFLVDNEKHKAAKAFKFRQKSKRLDPSLILTGDELNQLLAAATNLRDRAVIAVLADTGARIHEVCALRLKDVTVAKDGLVCLWFNKTKTLGQERSVELQAEASAIVRKWVQNYPKDMPGSGERALFPSHSSGHYGRPMNENSWLDRIKAIAKAAGFPAERAKQIHPHLFRHTAATRFLRMGLSEADVKKRLGWAPGSMMLGRYSHLVDEDSNKALRKLNGYKVEETVQVEKLVVPDGEVSPMPQAAPLMDMSKVMEQAKAAVRAEIAEQLSIIAATTAKIDAELKKLQGIRAKQG